MVQELASKGRYNLLDMVIAGGGEDDGGAHAAMSYIFGEVLWATNVLPCLIMWFALRGFDL